MEFERAYIYKFLASPMDWTFRFPSEYQSSFPGAARGPDGATYWERPSLDVVVDWCLTSQINYKYSQPDKLGLRIVLPISGSLICTEISTESAHVRASLTEDDAYNQCLAPQHCGVLGRVPLSLTTGHGCCRRCPAPHFRYWLVVIGEWLLNMWCGFKGAPEYCPSF